MVHRALITASILLSASASGATLDLKKDEVRERVQAIYLGTSSIIPHDESATARRFFSESEPVVDGASFALNTSNEKLWGQFAGEMSLQVISDLMLKAFDVEVIAPKHIMSRRINPSQAVTSIEELAVMLSSELNRVVNLYQESKLLQVLDVQINPLNEKNQ